jgi:hypothetical protein
MCARAFCDSKFAFASPPRELWAAFADTFLLQNQIMAPKPRDIRTKLTLECGGCNKQKQLHEFTLAQRNQKKRTAERMRCEECRVRALTTSSAGVVCTCLCVTTFLSLSLLHNMYKYIMSNVLGGYIRIHYVCYIHIYNTRLYVYCMSTQVCIHLH